MSQVLTLREHSDDLLFCETLSLHGSSSFVCSKVENSGSHRPGSWGGGHDGLIYRINLLLQEMRLEFAHREKSGLTFVFWTMASFSEATRVANEIAQAAVDSLTPGEASFPDRGLAVFILAMSQLWPCAHEGLRALSLG